jgi:hypothetical protein
MYDTTRLAAMKEQGVMTPCRHGMPLYEGCWQCAATFGCESPANRERSMLRATAAPRVPVRPVVRAPRATEGRVGTTCPTCFTTLSLTGACGTCD